MIKQTYYQICGIPPGKRGFTDLHETAFCPLCQRNVELVYAHMMDRRIPMSGYKRLRRCSICLVAIPLPKYIRQFLERPIKKYAKQKLTELPIGQMTL